MNDSIILTTLNARYMHSAFGLRYLYANLGELQTKAQILEFTIQQRPIDIVERLLETQPFIIGFSIYIWNVTEITQVIELLKQISQVQYQYVSNLILFLALWFSMAALRAQYNKVCEDRVKAEESERLVQECSNLKDSDIDQLKQGNIAY